ncbi:MAG: oxidoreductase [Gammaproteobacteria bacterium]|nr:oxidoreductase [Gammaproteobacteria bacterium]
MVYQIEVFLREVRRWFSRSEWMIRVLGLPTSKDTAIKSGLIIIQIDGLSHTQLIRAMNNGNLPFLKKLQTSEHYHLHSLYTGLPSSTPAVQGELFYGYKTAVPTFSFMDRETKEIHRMYEPSSSLEIEEFLKQQGEPLLKGGSAYCNIYTGGAEESHFCASSFGWGGLLRAANPFVLLFFLLTNIFSLVRTALLLFLEVILAIFDCITGFAEGLNLVKELKFIPTRVAICILLRELITIGTKIDIARGLPIIHLNFLGYDEQAHRRGPSSLFAHWSLKGIDRAIKNIWRAAHHSKRRHYDIWIYSDHGQEDVIPYPNLHEFEIEEAIANVFKTNFNHKQNVAESHGIQSHRARYLGGNKIQKLFSTYIDVIKNTNKDEPVITAMGPLGQVYSPYKLTTEDRNHIAKQLIEKAKVPLVIVKENSNQATAWLQDKCFSLPQDRADVFGANHPFLDELTDDIISICQHKNAGDFIICGWHSGIPYQTFRLENGSHAGPGENETHAFALLPGDTLIADNNHNYLRPFDLRIAAQNIIGREEKKLPTITTRNKTKQKTLRIMTYNVHSCIGMDGKISPERIARVIARYEPDVVALQELDVKKFRTGTVDQAHQIAKLLQMEFHFHPAIHIEEERYGDAILTHLPMKLIKADILPKISGSPTLEPRGAIWVQVEVNGTLIQILNTHLDVRPRPRRTQLEAVLGADWLGHADCKGIKIFCGDLNTFPSSTLYRNITDNFKDTAQKSNKGSPQGTFFTRFPATRIDYIFVNEQTEVLTTRVPNTELTRLASDHLPLFTDIRINN